MSLLGALTALVLSAEPFEPEWTFRVAVACGYASELRLMFAEDPNPLIVGEEGLTLQGFELAAGPWPWLEALAILGMTDTGVANSNTNLLRGLYAAGVRVALPWHLPVAPYAMAFIGSADFSEHRDTSSVVTIYNKWSSSAFGYGAGLQYRSSMDGGGVGFLLDAGLKRIHYTFPSSVTAEPDLQVGITGSVYFSFR